MKIIKDPIYGYIEIDNDMVRIIDTPNFQRLRYIVQTSYASIYPSSSHNRFSHSLGVFYLGKIASKALSENSVKLKKILKEKNKIFLLACLLHDLGHAPFSHTGEKFYTENKIENVSFIWRQLLDKISDEQFVLDASGNEIGKEHEIMSALLSINLFEKEIRKENFSFFCRCIIGLKHKDKNLTEEFIVENALIELLNSDIIDVDKLDYIIRDSYMTGFNSIIIDFKRLLQSVEICDTCPFVCYGKQSISAIESVITAHDMERKWIQMHPTIQYESYLIKLMIRHISSRINRDGNYFFSYNALLEDIAEFRYVDENTNIEQIINIRLLSDYDVLFLAKNVFNLVEAKEFYFRNERMHPIWKTEAEYRLYFNSKITDNQNTLFVTLLKSIEDDLLENNYGCNIINQDLLDAYTEEYNKTEGSIKKCTSKLHENVFKEKLKTQKNKKELLEKFKFISKKLNIPFEFVIITQNQFKSNINKNEFRTLQIKINGENRDLNEMIHFSDNDGVNDKFFYIYYRRDSKKKIKIEVVVKQLISFAVSLEA